MGRALSGAVLAASLLSGCSGSDQPILMNLRSESRGPDEFAILPNKPLQAPADMSQLPAPAPGRANRSDADPGGDAVAALGGSRGALSGGGVRDQALIARTTRFGVDPDIRRQLAAADLEYRRDRDGRLLERIFNVNVYYSAYEPYELDQYRELERFRRSGIRTPAAPPESVED
ncbi:DUF3035 domain-containing protein [Tranquillimonas rosea]